MSVRNQAVISSASIPFVFPPVVLDGMYLTDGGTFQNIALGDPIRRCVEEEGVEEKDIVVDIILCLASLNTIPVWSEEDTLWANAFDFYKRKANFINFYVDYEDMLRVTRSNPHVQYRYAVAPSETPPV